MNNEEFRSDEQRLEQAATARLRTLAAMPVDTSRLDRMIQAQIPRHIAFQSMPWFKPMRMAIAASLMVIIGLGALLILTSGGPVLASTAEMAQFHNDLVSGRVPVMREDSMQAANKALAEQWVQSPTMPNIPHDHVVACCMRSMKNKKMACVLLKGDGEPVTMTVANASDVRMPTSPVVTRNGIEYHVESSGDLNMVMMQRQGRWICLIAKLPSDRLMDLASGLEF